MRSVPDAHEAVLATAKEMLRKGLVEGTSGNISARLPDGNVVCTPSSVDYQAMVLEDLVVVDPDGEVVSRSEGRSPTSELLLHLACYRAFDDIGSVIRAYLIEGRPAFRLRETPTVSEAVDAIHAAGGVAVWAHPFWDVTDADESLAMVDRFRRLGIDGIEAFYVTHTREQTELLAARCAELDLLSTGSSDFHGPDNRLFSRFMAFETYGLEPNLGPIAG